MYPTMAGSCCLLERRKLTTTHERRGSSSTSVRATAGKGASGAGARRERWRGPARQLTPPDPGAGWLFLPQQGHWRPPGAEEEFAPLSLHPYTAPAAGADEDAFGGSLAAAAAAGEEAPAVRFRVVHCDAFAVNATAAELLRHRLRHDRRWASRISNAAAGGAAAAEGSR
jgi:hypothetical protein